MPSEARHRQQAIAASLTISPPSESEEVAQDRGEIRGSPRTRSGRTSHTVGPEPAVARIEADARVRAADIRGDETRHAGSCADRVDNCLAPASTLRLPLAANPARAISPGRFAARVWSKHDNVVSRLLPSLVQRSLTQQPDYNPAPM